MSFSVDSNAYNLFDGINNKMRSSITEINPLTAFITIAVMVMMGVGLLSLANIGGSSSSGSSMMGSFNSSMGYGSSGNGFVTVIQVLIVGLIIGLVAVNGLQYLYKIDIVTEVKNFFSSTPEIAVKVKQHIPKSNLKPILKKKQREKQVFHIPGNDYTYEDANALCKAYGAELADYDQIEQSYEDGGEWCSYGWSKDQMALFPTQKDTYKKLKGIPGHKNDCGRPGVNGGFIKNKKVRFGVNCYGFKPKMTDIERKRIEQQSLYPKTMKDKYEDYKVNQFRKKLKDIVIAPFNKNTWFKM
jgi:hypothetical protein